MYKPTSNTMDAMVIGYPRSGNTWLQYCISSTGGKECIKSHWYNSNVDKHVWVFPLRNYKECIVRHAEHGSYMGKVHSFFMEQTSGKPCRGKSNTDTDYIDLLKCFDAHKEPKILIYYEDLIQNPSTVLSGLFSFLKIETSKFMSDLKKHQADSIRLYKPGSATNGAKTLFHSLKIKPEILSKWDSHMEMHYPRLYHKYLYRYSRR